MRLMEKPIRFFTNIDSNIPNSLIGDEVRLRQILINLLSNAVKYSEKGHIGLTITVDKRDEQQVWLKIAVADTGKGIKKEDMTNLFGEFVKVDVKKNQGIEGTGLGLAITKRLCRAMSGDIDVESEYGKGSVFTAIIPQGIDSPEPFAFVEDAANKNVLVYEGRVNYAKSVCWTLNNMNVPYVMAKNHDDFINLLYKEKWFYVFSGYGLYEEIKPLIIEKSNTAFIGGKKPRLALMIEWGTEAFVPGVRFVSIPVQSLSIANVLNGKIDSKDYIKNSGVVKFSFSNVRVLVVDDIATNHKVIEGLLAPYNVEVDTCLSGLDAIDMVKRSFLEKRKYDIIFMDHMMPEMDGIEAAHIIRAWEKDELSASFSVGETRSNDRDLRKQIPIIALTANAVVGMREMFMENGFNDYLSKPINVSKLDEILNRWINKEKRVEGNRELGVGSREHYSNNNSVSNLYSDNTNRDSPFPTPHSQLPTIPGVDVKKGISLTGGTEKTYKQVLTIFCKDVKDRLPLLQNIPQTDALPKFTTNVHAIKSASASIGADEISALSAKLEAAGKNADMEFIGKQLPAYAKQLAELANNIENAFELSKPQNEKSESDITSPRSTIPTPYSPLIQELTTALKNQNTADIDRIIAELNEMQLDARTKETLEKISDEVLMTEFDNAIKILNSLIK